MAGRNWMALALLAPGSRTSSTNATAPLPDRNGGEAREFQLNLDGQQIGSELGAGNQPRFSQDSIAEFQFITNQFDATQGRSTGVQVNAITKSGTNQLTGLFRSNFQSSRFNAEDPVAHRVIPVSIQQYSTARRRTDHQGQAALLRQLRVRAARRTTSVWTTPYPAFNISLSGKSTRKLQGIRLDYQLSPKTRLMGKASAQNSYQPFGAGSSTSHPASTIDNDERNQEYIGAVHAGAEQPHAQRDQGRLQPLRLRQQHAGDLVEALAGAAASPTATRASRSRASRSTPTRTRRGIATRRSGRFATTSRRRTTRRRPPRPEGWAASSCATSRTARTARSAAARSTRAATAAVPAGRCCSRFSRTRSTRTRGTSRRCRRARGPTRSASASSRTSTRQPKYAGWAQDDWRITSKLTLNLGLRYDLSINAWANDLGFEPFYHAGPAERHEQPPAARRLCVSAERPHGHSRRHRRLLRRRADRRRVLAEVQHAARRDIQINNDGRADFAANPLNGQPLPTYAQAQNLFCHSPAQAANFAAWQARNFTGTAPCLLLALQEMPAPDQYMQMARSWTSSIGFQHQFGAVTQIAGGLRLHEGRSREGHARQHQPRLQPGDRRELSVHGVDRRTLPYPQYGVDLDDSAQHALEVRSAPDRVHQAHEPALAGVRHLHAVVSLGCGEPAVQRPEHRPVHGGAAISATSSPTGRTTSATASCSTASGRSRTVCS